MAGKARKKGELRRAKPRYTPKECILIVCEGKATEPNYFRGVWERLRISHSLIDVEVVGKGEAPITVVTRAAAYQDARQKKAKRSQMVDYDRVWCVFDVEAPTPHASLADALCKAKALQIDVALSNPCFEYWLLLHFELTGSPFVSNKKVVAELKKHIHNYKKGNDLADVLFPRIDEAISNAKSILSAQHHDPEDLVQFNPSTHVHLVVEDLQKMSTRQR